jgi:hypothetical protein
VVAVPALVGSNLTEGGGFFPGKEPPPGHGCVCMSPQGLTVGWWKEERHSSDTTATSAGFKSQAGWASHGCLCCISYCVVQKGKRRREGGRGWPGKVPWSPAAHKGKKRGKNKPTARYLIDQYGERGKAKIIKNKKKENKVS